MFTVIFYTERKSIRRSTAAKSAATQKRLRERNEEDKRRKIKVVKHDIWKPTQEELLEEALQTEEINTKSLGMYTISGFEKFCKKLITITLNTHVY